MDPEARSPKTWLLVICVAAAIVAFYAFVAPPPNKTTSNPSKAAIDNAAPGVDLLGQVLATNGVPITNASIFIYTAGPRSGPGFT